MDNPFAYIKLSISPARGSAFIGRQRQLAQIMDMIAAPRPHHISLYGLPHIGKSTLLERIHEEVSKHSGTMYVAKVRFTEGNFCNNMHSIIRELARADRSLRPVFCGVRLSRDPAELIGALRQVLQQLSGSGRRTVLLMDEFERILGPTDEQIKLQIHTLPGWTQEEYEMFLDLLTERELNFVCVTASRPQMSNILYRYFPAQNPFVPVLLRGFDDTEMKAYFDILRQGNICLNNIPLGQEPEQVQQQELLRICGRSPYLLTLMGNELFENNRQSAANARKTVKGLFRNCQGNFQTYFNEIISFIVDEEKKKMRSFSHIVKCYFGQFEDYQDIKERCIAKGYLELAAKDSPYTYHDTIFEFEDWDDQFEVIRENGAVMTPEEKKKAGLVYLTVSPLFTDYLFSVRQPIGKKEIIPLDLVDDTRDLLTGLIHVMRDITRREMRAVCQWEHISPNCWDEFLVSRYRAGKNSVQQIIHVNPDAQSNVQRYALWEKNTYGVTRLQSQANHPGQPNMHNWQAHWSSRFIPVAASSMKFVSERIRETDNEMASLDPISLIDQMEIFAAFWQYDNRPMFSNYFSILPNGQQQLRVMMEHLKNYRNKVSHFSRCGYGPDEIRCSRIYCRQLLKGIYYYLYSGKKCPAGSLSDTPGAG